MDDFGWIFIVLICLVGIPAIVMSIGEACEKAKSPDKELEARLEKIEAQLEIIKEHVMDSSSMTIDEKEELRKKMEEWENSK